MTTKNQPDYLSFIDSPHSCTSCLIRLCQKTLRAIHQNTFWIPTGFHQESKWPLSLYSWFYKLTNLFVSMVFVNTFRVNFLISIRNNSILVRKDGFISHLHSERLPTLLLHTEMRFIDCHFICSRSAGLIVTQSVYSFFFISFDLYPPFIQQS